MNPYGSICNLLLFKARRWAWARVFAFLTMKKDSKIIFEFCYLPKNEYTIIQFSVEMVFSVSSFFFSSCSKK